MWKKSHRDVSFGPEIFILSSVKPSVSREMSWDVSEGREQMRRWSHGPPILVSIRSACICFIYWDSIKILFEKGTVTFKMLEIIALGQISVLTRMSDLIALGSSYLNTMSLLTTASIAHHVLMQSFHSLPIILMSFTFTEKSAESPQFIMLTYCW